MKLKKLNTNGVAHHFLLALIVVGIITAFAFQAVAGHAQVTSTDQPHPCATGYALHAQVCETTVKPACPTGTTLKTTVDTTTKVSYYHCVNSAGVNISAGSEGIAPPAAPALVKCIVDVQKHVQSLTQAACTATQAKKHITKLGVQLISCSFTTQTGTAYSSWQSEQYCKSLKIQATNRLKALQNACEAKKANLSSKTVNPSYACVLDVQTRLKAAGIAVNVDGKFTATTDAAVRTFQAKHSPLVVDGVVGRCSWPTLVTGKVPAYCGGSTGTSTTSQNGGGKGAGAGTTASSSHTHTAVTYSASKCPTTTPNVNPGQSSNCVAYLQKRLSMAVIDGVYTPNGATYKKVTSIQSANNLKGQDGKVGTCTWEAINNPNTIEARCKGATDTTQITCRFRDPDTKQITTEKMTRTTCSGLHGAVVTPTVPKKLTYKTAHLSTGRMNPDSYALCVKTVKLSAKGATPSIKFGDIKEEVSTSSDYHYGKVTLQPKDGQSCYHFSTQHSNSALSGTITAGNNTGITSGTLAGKTNGVTYTLKLSNLQ